MPNVSAPVGVAAPDTSYRKTKHQQLLADQNRQLREFLDEHTKDNSPLPGRQGKVALVPLLIAAGLSSEIAKKSSLLRQTADEYAKKVGLTTVKTFQEKLPAPTPAALPTLDGMTYQELYDLDAGDLNLKSPKSLASYRSALSRFMELTKKSFTDQIGPEMTSEYEQTVQQFVDKHYPGDHLKAKSAKSYLYKYQKIVASRQLADGLPKALNAALRQLVEKDGRSSSALSAAIDKHKNYVGHLMSSTVKTASSATLTLLEKQLGVAPGTLTNRAVQINPRRNPNFCPTSSFPAVLQGTGESLNKKRRKVRRLLPDDFPSRPEGDKQRLLAGAVDDVVNNRHLSDYGRRVSNAVGKPYVLNPAQMTAQLTQELNDYCKMKHAKGSMAKGKGRRLGKRWKEGESGSEHLWRDLMNMFFGWCLLSSDAPDPMLKGAGLQPEDLTLGLILSPDLITDYIAFRNVRAENRDTKTILNFLDYCLSMLRAGEGWVEGNTALLERMPAKTQQAVSTWPEKCAAQFTYITELQDDLEIKVSRESFEPIQSLINLGRPMDFVQEALASNLKELNTKLESGTLTARQKAELFRDHVLISMLAALPLRASHWFGMTYRSETTDLFSKKAGELRHVDGQRWGLYLRAADFKNSRNTSMFGKAGEQDVAVLFRDFPNGLAEIELLIDTYMRVHRPHLCPGNGPVFPTAQGVALTGSQLYALVTQWTGRYLSELGDHHYGLRITGVRPFGPHAFRHLMATHILQTTGKFEDAANMLLDSITMVEKSYGQFMPKDRLALTFGRLDIRLADRS